MADNKKNRGGADRGKVAGGQDYEVRHVAKKTNTTPTQVKQAIKEVGNSRAKVEAELRKPKPKK